MGILSPISIKLRLFYHSILAIFPPNNPQDEQKERSHERLGIFRVLARSRESMTICHESEEVYTSDPETP